MTGTAKAPPSWLIEGIERTAIDYQKLLSRKGFRLVRVIPTAGSMSIVEAIPA